MAWLVFLTVMTSFAEPIPHEVASENGKFVLHVDPKTDVHAIYAKDQPAPLWTFTRGTMFEDFVVSNDGKTVAVINWHFVKVDELDDPGVELWRAGGLARSYSVRHFVSHPAHPDSGGAPQGWFWREWRSPFVIDMGDSFYVRTTGPFTYQIYYATGAYDRSINWEGAILVGYGMLSLLLAIVIAWLARRAARREEFAGDRRRIYIAATAPILAGVAQWLYFTGIPFVPASWTNLQVVVWLASVLMTIVGAFLLPKLAWRQRIVWVAGIVLLVAVPAVIRIA